MEVLSSDLHLLMWTDQFISLLPLTLLFLHPCTPIKKPHYYLSTYPPNSDPTTAQHHVFKVSLDSSAGQYQAERYSVRSNKTTGAGAAHKPNPTAVVAETEADYHTKAESLRRTNEKINAIEECIATDIGVEVRIREYITQCQRVIDQTTEKRAELDKALLQTQETLKECEEDMKMNKNQRRENHSAELEQLVKEQAAGFEELKKCEVAHHAELTEKIEGYKKNGQPFSIEGSIMLTL